MTLLHRHICIAKLAFLMRRHAKVSQQTQTIQSKFRNWGNDCIAGS